MRLLLVKKIKYYLINFNFLGIIFNSGIIAYPANRALCATAVSKSKKGRLFVLGSEKFFEDEYIEKEENKKITVIFYLFFYLLFKN